MDLGSGLDSGDGLLRYPLPREGASSCQKLHVGSNDVLHAYSVASRRSTECPQISASNEILSNIREKSNLVRPVQIPA
eukprot:562276-Amorphochlora_amoeboformis.AAC.2